MILGGDIDSLIDFFSFTVWIFYGMSMAAVILLRKTSPNLARPYKVPIFIPVLVLIGKKFALKIVLERTGFEVRTFWRVRVRLSSVFGLIT